MNTSMSAIHIELTWLFGLDTKGTLLPSTHLALVRIYWRHFYAAMVRLKYDDDIFSPSLVKQNIAHTFYSGILAFQHDRLRRYFRRRFSHQDNYRLPKSEATRLKPIGELRLSDGRLSIKPAILLLLQQQNIACENTQTLPTSSTSSRRSGNTSNCNNHSNRRRLTITNSSGIRAG
eukprot:6184184-Pleurochrysis_carterae.AAC.1